MQRLFPTVIWMPKGAFCENRCMDWELFLPIGFVILGSLGLVYCGLAAYHYFRGERSNDTPRLPVAMVAFAVQYAFVFALTGLSNYSLLRTILMFFTTMALLTAVRLGLQAHSKAGSRISLAGLFTLSAYICKVGSDYYQFAKFHRGSGSVTVEESPFYSSKNDQGRPFCLAAFRNRFR